MFVNFSNDILKFLILVTRLALENHQHLKKFLQAFFFFCNNSFFRPRLNIPIPILCCRLMS